MKKIAFPSFVPGLMILLLIVGCNSAADLYNEGYSYYNKKQYHETLRLWRKAADAGSVDAINGLGLLYLYGQGININYEKAMAYFQIAVKDGSNAAMNNVGYMYDKGLGVKEDNTIAIKWYQQAIDAGNADAFYSLGWMYDQEPGMPKDYY